MSTELCDFVKLVLDRMDTNPEEFIDGDPKHRWGAMSRGIIDWVMGETDTSSARSLWALEPHEREALTTKYKAIYLEREKRIFLKNILGGVETKSKKIAITKRGATPLTQSDITAQALKIMEDEWGKSWSNSTFNAPGDLGQNSMLASTNVASNALAGYTDARGLYANEQTAKVVKRQNESDNN